MTDVFGLWLESLDIDKVRGESFFTQAHRDMVRDHEARKRVEAIMRDQGLRRKRKRSHEYVFTDRQLEIAIAAISVD